MHEHNSKSATNLFLCDEKPSSLEGIQGNHVLGAQTSCETFSSFLTYIYNNQHK